MFIFAHFFIFSLFYSFYFLSLQGTSEQSCSSTHISLEKKEQLSWWQQLEQLNRQTYQDQAVDWQENNYIRYLERAFELRTKASPEARRALAAKVYVPIMQRPVIDKVTLENLDIVLGRQEPRHALVTAVNKTVTQLGFCALLHCVGTPIDNVKTLRERQESIRFFMHDPELFSTVRRSLEKIAQQESVILGFWAGWDPFRDLLKNYLFFNGESVLNESRWALEAKSVTGHSERFFWLSMHLVATIVLTGHGLALLSGYSSGKNNNPANFSHGAPFYSPERCSSYGGYLCSLLWGSGGDTLQGIVSLLGAGYAAMNIPSQWEWLKGSYLFERSLQKLLISLRVVLEEFSFLSQVLQEHPELALRLPCYKTVILYEQDTATFLAEYKELCDLLKKASFSLPSAISWSGILLRSYLLATRLKEHFSSLLSVVAEVDLYSSLACLCTERHGQENCYSFAVYEENDLAPEINASKLWNPLVKKELVAVNDFSLGAQGPRAALITGPNAGGKSTFLRGVALAQLLAQSITLVPASSYRATLFHAIRSSMNVSDAVAQDSSLFKAEIARACELIDTVAQAEKKKKFSLIIGDEIMRGTTPEEAEAAAFTVAQELGSYPSALFLLATHHQLLTKLEELYPAFINYHFSVDIREDGSLFYPFKIERGVSSQNIAFELLLQAGMRPEFLHKAQDLLKK